MIFTKQPSIIVMNRPSNNVITLTLPGKMPEVVISAWQKIWAMKPSDVGRTRKYIADFEVYDERAADPNNSIVDIYIGIEN